LDSVAVLAFAEAASGEIWISTNGGGQLRCRRDGKELFYVARDGQLMAVPVRLGSYGETVEASTPLPCSRPA
jgi:hypothetical protein